MPDFFPNFYFSGGVILDNWDTEIAMGIKINQQLLKELMFHKLLKLKLEEDKFFLFTKIQGYLDKATTNLDN